MKIILYIRCDYEALGLKLNLRRRDWTMNERSIFFGIIHLAFSLSYYLPIAEGRIIGFISFPRVLVLCEMQSVSSMIWTRVAVSFSYDDNHYIMGTSNQSFILGTSIVFTKFSLKAIVWLYWWYNRCSFKRTVISCVINFHQWATEFTDIKFTKKALYKNK